MASSPNSSNSPAGQLAQLIERGDARAATELLSKTQPASKDGDDWGDAGLDAACCAVAAGRPDIALRLLDLGKTGGSDLLDLLNTAAETNCMASFVELSSRADRHDLLHAAYKSFYFNNWQPCEISTWAIQAAGDSCDAEWARAVEQGLFDAWSQRDKLRYEAACDAESIPIWAASCAPPLTPFNEPSPFDISWPIHSGSGLRLVHETLLWDGREFAHWRKALLGAGESDGHAAHALDSMEDSHRVCINLFSEFESSISKARQHDDPRHVADLARRLSRGGCGPWIPMILAWGHHCGFSEDDEARLEPLLSAAIIDDRNVGMLAANWTYGSFSARIAQICCSIVRRGGASEASILALSARAEDLAEAAISQPKIFNSAFQSQYDECAVEIKGFAEAIEIARASRKPIVSAKPAIRI